jgi:hypothetical protein
MSEEQTFRGEVSALRKFSGSNCSTSSNGSSPLLSPRERTKEGIERLKRLERFEPTLSGLLLAQGPT